MPNRIYIDTCALNRLADDHSQGRVWLEAEAMIRIFDLIATRKLVWCASPVLRLEIERNSDIIRRVSALKLLSNATEMFTPAAESLRRASELAAEGLSYLDALHLAMAELADADWLLTTDDRFLKQARTRLKIERPELINPVDWIERRHPWLLLSSPAR